MQGTKHLSELITDPRAIVSDCINIIEANTSAGKTYFALNTLPRWAGSPAKILYLIDTNNGELRIQQNILAISRADYSFAFYGEGTWGEDVELAKDKMPVMTYAGFGSEVRNSRRAFWQKFDYIVCDEMQNLVNYQGYGNPDLLRCAETTLRNIAVEGKTKIIALSATPSKIRQHFGTLCRDVPFDADSLIRYDTGDVIPYTGIEKVLMEMQSLGRTGILYVQQVETMKKYIAVANEHGMRANGFWSINNETQKKHPMTAEQFALRDMVLAQETFPEDLDLLVINAASETCIKIQVAKRKVDFMIIHKSNVEVQTQVRGRYCGDLPQLYIHTDNNEVPCHNLPPQYLNVPLFKEEKDAVCELVNLRAPNGRLLKWPSVSEYLEKNGFTIKPTRNQNRRGHIIKPPSEYG